MRKTHNTATAARQALAQAGYSEHTYCIPTFWRNAANERRKIAYNGKFVILPVE